MRSAKGRSLRDRLLFVSLQYLSAIFKKRYYDNKVAKTKKMCYVKLSPFLRTKWIELQFAYLDITYNTKLKLIIRTYNAQINNLRQKNHRNQIQDLLVCINFKLHFISPLLPEHTLKKINKHKQIYYRRGNLKKMIDLADIIYHCNLEDIEKEFLNLLNRKKP